MEGGLSVSLHASTFEDTLNLERGMGTNSTYDLGKRFGLTCNMAITMEDGCTKPPTGTRRGAR
jgi:hypothetical protein